ncbi:hypothetical protein WJX72_002870 [[Myrmecia] bisecta]|uniref:Serine incorporator n=1 Tax=[Myrmecia] bisecta TaxID=41462 RepID=A0AAW1QPT6_9CHLO
MFVLSYAGSALASCAAMCACQACGFAARETFRKSARLAYCVLFTLAMVLAWVLRDFARPLMEKIPWIFHHASTDPSDEWYGQQAVYRVSMGNFMFFGLLSAVLVGVRYKSDKRDQYLQHGGWFVKITLWLLCNALPFFFPVSVVNAYSWAARFGSGAFLIVQMIILLDLTQSWNDSWVAKEDNRYLYALLGITLGAYVGAATLAGLLFWLFAPSGSECSFNICMITLTLVLCLAFSLLSLHPSAQNGSLFPSAVITLYCTYLCYSALQSEPHNYPCNGVGHKYTAASATTLAAGMLLTLLSVVYSALRAGSNTQTFMTSGYSEPDAAPEQPLLEAEEGTSAGLDGEAPGAAAGDKRGDKAISEFETVTYSYSFFHLIFALASMYIAMLMTGWGTGAEEKDLIDVGWTSVWVKLASQWLTALLYAWTLAAPLLFPDRTFG